MTSENPWFHHIESISLEITDPDPSMNGSAPNNSGDLPDPFWSADVFSTVLRVAQRFDVNPTTLLLSTLARFSSFCPPGLLTPELATCSPKPLALNVCSVGRSGQGKGEGMRVASTLLPQELLQLPPGEVYSDDANPASGEGVAGTFTRPRRFIEGGEEVTKRVTRAMAQISEGSAVADAIGRDRSTLAPVICKAFTSESLSRAKADHDVVVAAGTYVYSMLISIQDANFGQILAHADTGVPQRFLYCSARPPWSVEAALDRPRVHGAVRSIVDQLPPCLNRSNGSMGVVPVEVEPFLLRELVEARHHGYSNPLHAHVPLLRSKVASLLALLAGRCETTIEDWGRAALIVETSRRYLETLACQEQARQEQARESHDRIMATTAATSAVAVEDALERKWQARWPERTNKALLALKAEGSKGLTRRGILGGQFGGQRRNGPEALSFYDHLISHDDVVEVEDNRGISRVFLKPFAPRR